MPERPSPSHEPLEGSSSPRRSRKEESRPEGNVPAPFKESNGEIPQQERDWSYGSALMLFTFCCMTFEVAKTRSIYQVTAPPLQMTQYPTLRFIVVLD